MRETFGKDPGLQPRRALLSSSDAVNETFTAPRRVQQKKLLSSLALPLGITGPLAAVMAVSVITTAVGSPAQGFSASSDATVDVASRVAARPGETVSDDAAQEKQITRDAARSALPTTSPSATQAKKSAASTASPSATASASPTTAKPTQATAAKVVGTWYTTSDLNVRQAASKTAEVRGTLNEGESVKVTNTVTDGYRQVLYNNKAGWVLSAKLTSKKPANAAASGSVTTAACRLGSGVESGLRSSTINVYRSVCANYPQITSYGGVRQDSMEYHPSGRALDIMLPSVSDNALGWSIAKWVVSHASEFNLDHVIFDQKIWVAGSSGWRSMSDRGGITANHKDHVHVAVKK